MSQSKLRMSESSCAIAELKLNISLVATSGSLVSILGERQAGHVVDQVGAVGRQLDAGRVALGRVTERRRVRDAARRAHMHVVAALDDPVHRRAEVLVVLLDVVGVDDRPWSRHTRLGERRARLRRDERAAPAGRRFASRSPAASRGVTDAELASRHRPLIEATSRGAQAVSFSRLRPRRGGEPPSERHGVRATTPGAGPVRKGRTSGKMAARSWPTARKECASDPSASCLCSWLRCSESVARRSR